MIDSPLAIALRNPKTAAKLAKRIGCTISYLRNIRDGRRTPSMRIAKRLSETLKMSMDAFLQPETAKFTKGKVVAEDWLS